MEHVMVIEDNVEVIKKKRGRKKKSEMVDANSAGELFSLEETNVAESAEKIPKKRGRKPKGGKIIMKQPLLQTDACQVANIILHLRCSIDDIERNADNTHQMLSNPLEYVPTAPPNVLAYIPGQIEKLSAYNEPAEPIQHNAYQEIAAHDNLCRSCKNQLTIETLDVNNQSHVGAETVDDEDVDMKTVGTKLKQLKLRLYKNTANDKKSACFWCTYEYDNPPCYIPKSQLGDDISGYGSFCRPECAAAYLMKENIDDSAKFERYQLLNKFYGKVCDYKNNIKPAPDPHFLLDKFYGNMTIQEFRKLLGTDHMLLVVEKPMTRILPELHDDADESSNKLYGNASGQSKQTGVYKVKRQSEKTEGPTKTRIMKESFGFA